MGARHAEQSIICSADDEAFPPTRSLIEDALRIVAESLDSDMTWTDRGTLGAQDKVYADTWPGEHYRLLVGTRVLEPRLAVEVGTFTGLGSLALRQACDRVVTFDLIPWDRIEGSVLREQDFENGSLRQEIGDLARADTFDRHRDLLSEADVIFVDGPKDGTFEPAFMTKLLPIVARSGALVIFDDIRVMSMIGFWRSIRAPKLDLTSFGHWSGTGLVRFDA